jgi:hypothetical protein
MNQKKKIYGSTYLAAAHLAEPISPATTVQPGIPFRVERSSSSSSRQAAGWSSGRHTIHRRLLDDLDEDHRPPMRIKGVCRHRERTLDRLFHFPRSYSRHSRNPSSRHDPTPSLEDTPSPHEML